MAVERPNTWVILLELQDHEAWFDSASDIARILQLVNVATKSVLWVDDAAIPLAIAFREHMIVVAMEMHGMPSGS